MEKLNIEFTCKHRKNFDFDQPESEKNQFIEQVKGKLCLRCWSEQEKLKDTFHKVPALRYSAYADYLNTQ